MAQGKTKLRSKKKKSRLSKMKKNAKRTRIAGTVKHRKKKKALSDPLLHTNKRVSKAIRKNIEGIVASKVALSGKRFIFGELNDKGKTKLKSSTDKRDKREMKKKRRFISMEDKIQQELSQLRRDA